MLVSLDSVEDDVVLSILVDLKNSILKFFYFLFFIKIIYFSCKA